MRGDIPRVELAPGYTVPRILVGTWQLSEGHRRRLPAPSEIFDVWSAMVEAGLSTFDVADIYTGVEELLGQFREHHQQRHGSEAAAGIRIHTKLVPDRNDLSRVDRAYVQNIVDRSLRRLRVERLDLVQLAWWDYTVPGFVETAAWLDDLRRAGKIRHLAATNFSVPTLTRILDAGIPIVAHQVQYSLLDHRPERGMVELCRAHGVGLLCYGTLAGGFLTERYHGAAEPATPHQGTRSLVKYRLIVAEFGGWAALQDLLDTLDEIARKYGAGIAQVALRYVLERPGVAAAILGATTTEHLAANLSALRFRLDAEDRQRLAAALKDRGPAGDVFELERVPGGPHAAIMRYNLNAG